MEESDIKSKKPQVNQKLKRFTIKFAKIVIGGYVVLTLLGLLVPKYQQYKINKAQERLDKLQEEYINKQKQDIYGGKTPEETIDMLIEALKQNNPDLASRYYVLRNQQKAKKEFEDELNKNGNLNASAEYFKEVKEKGEKVCHDLDNMEIAGCNFEYIYIREKDEYAYFEQLDQELFFPKGSKGRKIIDLRPNPYTNTWKIVQP